MQSFSNKSSFTPLEPKGFLTEFTLTPLRKMLHIFIRSKSSFTLIELLIVIGILAILTAAVVIVLNPTELLKQGRDSKRMTDLASINNALKILQTQNDALSLGTASTVYISIPDTSSTCANLGLPILPAGYTYRCVPTASSTALNGTGWIPVDFTQSNVQNISTLPLDTTNTTSSYLYYTYMTSNGRWKLTAAHESKKYTTRAAADGGIQPGALEAGTDMNILSAEGASCAAIKTLTPGASSGLYWIKPNAYAAVQVYCDMVNDGGGWTLVLNNGAYTIPPKPNWIQATTQNNVTGSLSSTLTTFDQFLGVGYWNDIGTQMKLEQGASPTSLSHKAIYTFSLDKFDNFRLSMSDESILITLVGSASSGMYINERGQKLTTYDNDNDIHSSNCSSFYSNTSWWYENCWSGSFWGGGDAGGYQNAPFWRGSSSEYFSWGGIWIK